jgi:hypothetical protein
MIRIVADDEQDLVGTMLTGCGNASVERRKLTRCGNHIPESTESVSQIIVGCREELGTLRRRPQKELLTGCDGSCENGNALCIRFAVRMGGNIQKEEEKRVIWRLGLRGLVFY